MTGSGMGGTIRLFVLLGLSMAGAAVVNQTTHTRFATLEKALHGVKSGETLYLEKGIYRGNFRIERSITLSGDPGGETILDGGGRGTVVTVAADNVTVKDLTIRGSGKRRRMYGRWGDAGILAEGSGFRMERVTLENNEWGLIAKEADRGIVRRSTFRSNRKAGLLIMGGSDHRIEKNLIRENEAGIVVTYPSDGIPLQGRSRSSVKPAHHLLLSANRIESNRRMGILVSWYAHHIGIERNRIVATGTSGGRKRGERSSPVRKERNKPVGGKKEESSRRPGEIEPGRNGAGIFLSCFATRCRILENNVSDNAGNGIDFFESDHNVIAGNLLRSNFDGISLNNASGYNTLCCNRIGTNRRYGIAIDAFFLLRPRSMGNLLSRNDLWNNGRGDARDEAGARHSDAVLFQRIRESFPPGTLRNSEMLVRALRQKTPPGLNYWDDGTYGNRYSRFDEPAEGYTDRNGDGIGEVPYRIPGGESLDRRPLDFRTVDALIRATPLGAWSKKLENY